MTTPTCRTCGTKFPGRDICKSCGVDPAAEPNRAARAARVVKAMPKPSNAAQRRMLKYKLRSIQNAPRKRKHGRA